MKTGSLITFLLAAFACLAIAVQQTSASVEQYHDHVQGLAETIVQYNFDGNDDAERREDKIGDNNLVQKLTTTYGQSGFDWSSQAVQGGFFTTDPLNLPPAASFEAIFAPLKGGAGSNGYLIATFDGSHRGYFVLGEGLQMAAAAGNSWQNRSVYVNPYTVGDWYYVAATMSYDSGINKTTINTYLANLSNTERTLTHNASTVTGDFHTGLAYGIGLMNYNGSVTQPFASIIDEVTFYDELKDGDFFQDNLDRIYIPEPTTLLIWSLLAGLGVGLRWRRRR